MHRATARRAYASTPTVADRGARSISVAIATGDGRVSEFTNRARPWPAAIAGAIRSACVHIGRVVPRRHQVNIAHKRG